MASGEFALTSPISTRLALKDSFPLPRIDQMVDATAGHELLSFMDSYFGYNQIKMYPPDEDKTTFITNRGIYCYKVMSFWTEERQSNLPTDGQQGLQGADGHTMKVYVDDMFVKSH